MKILGMIILLATTLSTTNAQNVSFHSFVVTDIDGNEFPLSKLKGKKVMVVNTASKCGFTPQYEDLQALYDKYKDKNFVIIGFPANNFMGQEPGTNQEIKEFCTTRFSVSFPMMAKISVKGNDTHPLYQWLTQKSMNGVMDSEVKWNFQKYLIDENGKLVDMIPPKEKPNSDKVIKWIEGN
ncbi:MAG: glutathione peroxidase [Tenuifilum sp.]|mgnify:FL=1|uniref:glutathione peroxidase n=1 Tax=Tenuifilum sp. TaxID=2760880 RepID=UPI001B4B07F4|nr:glutathione peroxidase [Bacteroidales bacterium]HOK60323.1 glutathione peroxidase [Tenuifilum sp.]MBP9029127.1 glutathione peroxidase [Bacteroidales bacterium]HOK85235.1 glutathione peroxidase [Tenuifilum sp.]HON69611.1 glutathione peroxidase [Tenuifilum sp.]